MTRAAPESKRFPAHFFAANQDLRQERARRIKSMIRLGPVCCSALADARTFADRKVCFRRHMSAENTIHYCSLREHERKSYYTRQKEA